MEFEMLSAGVTREALRSRATEIWEGRRTTTTISDFCDVERLLIEKRVPWFNLVATLLLALGTIVASAITARIVSDATIGSNRETLRSEQHARIINLLHDLEQGNTTSLKVTMIALNTYRVESEFKSLIERNIVDFLVRTDRLDHVQQTIDAVNLREFPPEEIDRWFESYSSRRIDYDTLCSEIDHFWNDKSGRCMSPRSLSAHDAKLHRDRRDEINRMPSDRTAILAIIGDLRQKRVPTPPPPSPR